MNKNFPDKMLGRDVIEITPEVAVVEASMGYDKERDIRTSALPISGVWVHKKINGVPQESFYVDIPLKEITEEKLKKEGII